jgi:hypothetical protein
MCEFVSWKNYDGTLWFLTDDIIAPRLEEFKLYNPEWREDLPGHWAIEWFFYLPEHCGRNKECTDFSSPSNFPPEIVREIKQGKMTYGKFSVGLLLPTLDADYEAKRVALDADDRAKWDALDADYEAKRVALDAELWAKRVALDAELWAKWDALDAEMWALFSKPENRAEAWR